MHAWKHACFHACMHHPPAPARAHARTVWLWSSRNYFIANIRISL